MERADDGIDSVAELGFSLTEGGPLHRALLAVGATDGPGLVRVALLLGAAAWAPLIVASVAEGLAIGWEGAFARDVGVHVRLLMALPLALLAERPIARRLGRALSYLLDAGLIDDANRAPSSAALRRARRLRDHLAPELVLAFAALALSSVDLHYRALGPRTWSFPAHDDVSIAGWIGLGWSVPLARFILLRWAWRLVVWTVLLAGLARARLRINAAHPDGRGGLGFLWDAHTSFGWLALAMGVALAGNLTTEKLLAGLSVTAYRTEVLVFTFGVPVLFLSPLFAFAWPIEQARRRFKAEYGSASAGFVARYARAWIDPPTRESLPLGTGETSTHTDLVTSYARVDTTRALPFSRRHYIALVIAAGIPMLVFMLEDIPLLQILRRIKDTIG